MKVEVAPTFQLHFQNGHESESDIQSLTGCIILLGCTILLARSLCMTYPCACAWWATHLDMAKTCACVWQCYAHARAHFFNCLIQSREFVIDDQSYLEMQKVFMSKGKKLRSSEIDVICILMMRCKGMFFAYIFGIFIS